ncbi:uncharacterized protein LOC131847227, partial [Achroia grisella]|uniref:uncharacterized protein LOC131847227 n=1 Tax=Achroia grisella TaxID=688607 RepID=UPI0027D22458
QKIERKIENNYTECIEKNTNKKCAESVTKPNKTCTCILYIKITEKFYGERIKLYFELPSYQEPNNNQNEDQSQTSAGIHKPCINNRFNDGFSLKINGSRDKFETVTDEPFSKGESSGGPNYTQTLNTSCFENRLWYLNATNTLESGSYKLRIDYNYPVTEYNGTRMFILSTYRIEENRYKRGTGIALLNLGPLLFIISAIFYYKNILHKKN